MEVILVGGTEHAPTVRVDIATRTVGPDEDFYVVRPGASYTLYNEFERTNRVFLDFPGLGLPLNKEPEPTTLRQMIARGMAIREWHQADVKGQEPPRNLAAFADKTKGRKFGRYQAAIKKLYYELPVGTVIVVPGHGLLSDVLIGVLQGPAALSKEIASYPGETIPFRAVKWVGRRQRSDFSPELRERLGNSHPVMQLDRSMRLEILTAGFDRFIFENQFSVRLQTTKAEFNTLDDYHIQHFVNFVAGALAVMGTSGAISPPLSMADALASLRARPDLIPELTSNINSPGFLSLVSDKVSPLVIAVLLSAALAMPSPVAAGTPPEIKVVNSAAPKNDPCAVQVAAEARGALKLMRYDDWKIACEQARDAHHSTGVKTNMRTTVQERTRSKK